MKRKSMHFGLIMGAAMMAAVNGAGPALAAGQAAGTQKDAAVSASAQDKGKDARTGQKKEDAKKETLFYGKVKKLEKDKLLLDGASIVWEKEIEKEKESPAGKAKSKDNNVKESEKEKKAPARKTKSKDTNVKEASADASVSADFETEMMKWKLNGQTVEIKIDKDTKYVKSVLADDTDTEKAAAGTGTDKKGADTGKAAAGTGTDKKGADTGKAAAGTGTDKKDKDSGKSAKTGQESGKAVPSEGSETVQTVAAELKDVREGMFLKVTVKDDGSMIASEVLILSDVKEIKPAGQEGTDKTGQPKTKTETKAETKTETKAKTKTETKAKAKTETKAKAKTETKTNH